MKLAWYFSFFSRTDSTLLKNCGINFKKFTYLKILISRFINFLPQFFFRDFRLGFLNFLAQKFRKWANLRSF